MANEGPAAGTYRIVSGPSEYDHPYCLEVGGGDMKSGANVQIWGKLFAASQFWKITYDSSGAARIVNLASGKSLDVYAGTMANGTNVRQFNDNGTTAQRWVFSATGSFGSFEDGSYPTYKILSKKSTSYALDIDGSTLANRKNVQIWSAYDKPLQTWMFVPMPAFASGGTYEIRSMLKTSMCLDVAGGSGANGANIQLWSANDSNAQKFYVTEETSGQWSVMSVSSGKYVDVKNGGTTAGTNVQQYADNDSRSQRWKLTQYGTTSIGGIDCAVVTFGSYVTGSGNTLLMDVKNALTTNSANVQLGAAESGTDYSQRFALYPTSPKSTDLAVPAKIGWVATIGDTDRKLVLDESETLYPSWVTATSWTSDSANGFQWRHRAQTRSASSGTWGDFGEWSEWAPVAVQVSKTDVWAADGLPALVPSGSTALQYELQVRAISYEGDSDDDGRTGGTLLTGDFAAATLRAVAVIEMELGSTFGFGPEGLRIPYSTQYDGTVNLVISNMRDSQHKNVLPKPMTFEDMDSSGTVLIPVSKLSRWLEDSETLLLDYTWGTDQGSQNSIDAVGDDPHTVSYNTGSGMSVTPTISVGSGRTLEVRVVSANVSKAWLRRDGEITDMYVKNNVGHVLYPFGSDLGWELFVAAHNNDGDRWGVALVDGTQFNSLVSGFRPCHAFNWDDGSFLLEVREGDYLETDYSIDNDAQGYKLNKREWDAYRIGSTKTGKYKAVGALYDLLDLESTKADLEALVDAKHVTYRSPHGDMADVAVLGATMTCKRDIWTVTIDMARETV